MTQKRPAARRPSHHLKNWYSPRNSLFSLKKIPTLGNKSYTVPKTNTEFWTAKVSRNQERDQEVWRKLEAKGWSVIIVWECELEKSRLEDAVFRVAQEIRANGELFNQRKDERRVERERWKRERAAKRLR